MLRNGNFEENLEMTSPFFVPKKLGEKNTSILFERKISRDT